MQTDRILLRQWTEADAEALFKYASDPDVGPRAGWPAPVDRGKPKGHPNLFPQ